MLKGSLSEELLLKSVFGSLLFKLLFFLVEAFFGTENLAIFRLLEPTGTHERLSKFEVNALGICWDASLALIN